MEIDPPPPPEAPPPPVVGIASHNRFETLDAPVLLPDFPGQPFSVSIKGIFYPHADGSTTYIGPSDKACPPKQLMRFAQRHCKEFAVKGLQWTKLAAQLEVRRRFMASAVSASPMLIHNHIRPGSTCYMYTCTECNAFADIHHKTNLTDPKRHKCIGYTIRRVEVVKFRCGRPILKSSLPALPKVWSGFCTEIARRCVGVVLLQLHKNRCLYH